ncbi:hypothetical protein [uncultured Microscilla sp.]|uniref:hypothetical protein n=1 Tax=uncultured Microscilla sp. TaxID=432653 RepID=UPI00262733D3|nr:hypothetical protein [uncultured Microscilla sp.]
MLKKFFSKKSKTNPVAPPNPLFDLFPLSETNHQRIATFVKEMFERMFDEENIRQMTNFTLEYPVGTGKVAKLLFDDMGWQQEQKEGELVLVCQQTGGYFHATAIQVQNKLKHGQTTLPVYRQWLTKQYIDFGGGVVLCERFSNVNGVEGFESISKIPKPDSAQGVDYIYFLNIPNFKDNILYQISIKMFEQGTKGLRDNLLMRPLMDIAEMTNSEEFMKHYFRDPYDHTNRQGLPMNVSEKEAFDHLYPFHPLSIIRQVIRKRLMDSLKWES